MRSLLVAVFVATLAHHPAATAAGPVGVTSLSLTAPERGRQLVVTLWYPAGPGGASVRVGENAVFEGVAAQQDAPVAAGRLPLVLLTHGGLRSAPDLDGWIASRLAGQGYLAATVRGPRIGPDDAEAAVAEIWERPADLSAALTALMDTPAWADHLDPERVAALGFFLGGTSVLSLAGGRLDADAFMRSCDAGGGGPDCRWFAAGGVDLRSVDVGALTRPARDPRVRAAIAVGPEYGASFTPESLAAIAVPLQVVTLGPPDAPGLDAAAAGIARVALPDATRFDAFSLCTPRGAAILAEEEGDDAMCRDGTRDIREGVHRELSALILDFLGQHLPPAR